MGVFQSREVEPEHTKRDVSSEPECAPSFTWYSTTCHGTPLSTIAACVNGYPTADICDDFGFNCEACSFPKSQPLDHACLVLQRSAVCYFKGCLLKIFATIVMMTMFYYLFRL